MILLIHPPVTRPTEPPAGLARLSGALFANGIRHRVLDANMEGLAFLLQQPRRRLDTWTRRAGRNLDRHLALLRNRDTYSSPARYQRAVLDINRLIETSIGNGSSLIGLSNYQDSELSPLRSADLYRAALHPEANPFYPYFSRRLKEIMGEEPPGYAGFSLNYLGQALSAFSMLGFLRENYPRTRIILGGGLVTSWMRNGLEKPLCGLADHFIAGPGEVPLLEILGVNGDRQAHYTPSYDLFPLRDYLSPGIVLPYSGSSGCWWNGCAFCPERAEGNPYLPIPAGMVSEDLALLVKGLKPSLIHFLDNSQSIGHMRALK
ncbi:MAG: radical SAM protein, partial [Smithellaceae bacterium]|nr:radical SAM protein [Smithellaceae bacterium]